MGRRALTTSERAEKAERERERARQRRAEARQNKLRHDSNALTFNVVHHELNTDSSAEDRPNNVNRDNATLHPIDGQSPPATQTQRRRSPRLAEGPPDAPNIVATAHTVVSETNPRTEAPSEQLTRPIEQEYRRSPKLPHSAPALLPQAAAEEQNTDTTIVVAATAVFDQFHPNEQPTARPGRPRNGPAISPRAQTRLRVQQHRDRQHLARVQSIAQQQEDFPQSPLAVELSALAIHDDTTGSGIEPTSEPSFDVVPLPSSPGALSSAASQGALPVVDSAPPTPKLSLDCPRQDEPPPEIGSSPVSAGSSSSFSGPSSPFTPPASSSHSPILDGFLQAIHSQETAGGADFLRAQSDVYDQVFQTFFRFECDCPHPQERGEVQHTHTLQESVQHLSHSLPPLSAVFGEGTDACDPRASFPQWQSFLSSQPPEPLSFRKTQANLPQTSVTIMRRWDIDSIWLGAKDLAAIKPPNDFHLCFLPPYKRNFSTNQVVQPHGLVLANIRHIPIGYFATGCVRMSVFLFFPNAARSATSASSNSLSSDRQRDLYDKIIIPAAYETVPDPIRQEIPSTYDIAYAKSRSFKEKPGAGRWSEHDESRSFQLAYNIPAECLSRFWASIIERANSVRIPTRRGEAIAYFQNPRLLFQAHDLKNTFARPSLREVATLFQDVVLARIDPNRLDMHSCWLDIGIRDYVSDRPSSDRREPWTLLWKSECIDHLHTQLMSIAPDESMVHTYFRSFLLRDATTYNIKPKPTKTSNPGHPEARRPGIIRAKAYSCNKELFGVMFSDYHLFGSGFLPLLAFDDGMVKDLSTMNQSRRSAYVPQLNRHAILRAWEANKRHLKAISNPEALTNYGIRKEVTFRLDAILTMWSRGSFHPDDNPHTGSLTRVVPLNPEPGEHYPFWAVHTKDINAFIFTQAARLILPLDYFFTKALPDPAESTSSLSSTTSASSSILQILNFYTAQVFCRLLVHAFSSEPEFNFDKWIWQPVWTVKARGRLRKERRGLGLNRSVNNTGMLWIPRNLIDWRRGHLSLETLIDLYIPRSPLQTRIAHQTNVQILTTSQVNVEFILQRWLQEAQQAFDQGRDDVAKELTDRAIRLATEEIARAYHQHFLAKVELYWTAVRDKLGRSTISKLSSLQQAQAECNVDAGRIPTAQTMWEIYIEAWSKYTAVVPSSNEPHSFATTEDENSLPKELPCWVTNRRRLPPKNSWCDFIFDHLFGRTKPPSWARLHFLQVYQTFKGFWQVIEGPAGAFDDYFKTQIGRYIMVAFNSDQSKEVGTKHAQGTWYHGKPPFFQIQYWAPYFSPPRTGSNITLQLVYPRPRYPEGLDPFMTPEVLSTRAFQSLETLAQREWLHVMLHTDQLRSADSRIVQRHCRRALRCMTLLAGPFWGSGEDVGYVMPWNLVEQDFREYGDEDTFRVPISEASISTGEFDTTVSLPTILLPTRHNVISLLNTMRRFPCLSPSLNDRIKWAMRRFHNDGQQYDLYSHLESKQQAAESTEESQTLLQRFLCQTTPPEREFESEAASGIAADNRAESEEGQEGEEEEEEEEGEEEDTSEMDEDESNSQYYDEDMNEDWQV